MKLQPEGSRRRARATRAAGSSSVRPTMSGRAFAIRGNHRCKSSSRSAHSSSKGTRGAASLPRVCGANRRRTRTFFVPHRSTSALSRSALLERKFLKKAERSAARSQTAFFRMLAELNDLPEVTGAAVWRFREQSKPLLLNQNEWGRPATPGREFTDKKKGTNNMNSKNKRGLERLERVSRFAPDAGISLNPLGTSIATAIGAAVVEIKKKGGDQASGHGGFSGGFDERERVADALRAAMRPIARTAKVLDPQLYPGAAAKFRVPRDGAYIKLLSAARAFVTDATPIKQAFIDHGHAATFLDDLDALIDDFDAGTGLKNGGRQRQIGGTASIAADIKAANKDVRRLDTIVSNQLENNPGLLAS